MSPVSRLLVSAASVLRAVTVEPVLFLYMLGITLLFSVFQSLIYQKVCTHNFEEHICSDLSSFASELSVVQESASGWVRVSTVAMVLPSLAVDCYLGAWSDRVGRKATLVLPPVGAAAASVVYCLMVSFSWMGVSWILLASFLMGVFGSFTSVYTTVTAYIASHTDRERRTERVGLAVAMSLAAATVGPFLSGAIAQAVSHLAVFVATFLCHAAAVVYVVIRIPNDGKVLSEKTSSSLPSSVLSLFSLSHVKESFTACFVHKPRAVALGLSVLFAMAFIVMTVTAGVLDISFLYLSDVPLSCSFPTFTHWLGLRFGLSSLGLVLVLPVAKRCGASDAAVCAVGIVSHVAGLVLLGVSSAQYMIFIETVISSLSQLGLAAIRAMVSHCVDSNEQGKVFGLLAVLEDVSTLSGTLIFNSLYPATRRWHNGTMLWAAAAALLVPLGLVFVLTRLRRSEDAALKAPIRAITEI